MTDSHRQNRINPLTLGLGSRTGLTGASMGSSGQTENGLGGWLGRRLAVLLVVAVAALWTGFGGAGNAEARQYASVVLDADSGRVILDQNSSARTYPASLTKIMTLYLVFDAVKAGRLNFDQRIPVSANAARQPPSKLGLRAGATIAVRDAVMSVITRSANDMAMALAEAVGGDAAHFAAAMTARARQIGMTDTVFRNPSGLPDDQQRTTARDMAKLGMAIMRDHADYYPYFATQVWRYDGKVIRNHNRMLGRYRGVNGIKTGYINASGFNLVVSVERDGRHLVGVIFGGKSARSRDDQMIVLLDRAFARLKQAPRDIARADIIRPNRVAPVALAAIIPPEPARRPDLPEARPGVETLALDDPSEALDAKIAALDEETADSDDAYRADALAADDAPGPAPVAKDTDTANGLAADMTNGLAADAVAAAAAVPSLAAAIAPLANTLGAQLAAHGTEGTAQPAGNGGSWGVQIGAFSGQKTALSHLQETAELAPDLFTASRMAVHQLRDKDAVIYRARFVGMTEMSARQACLALRERQRACIAMKMPATMAASTLGGTTSNN